MARSWATWAAAILAFGPCVAWAQAPAGDGVAEQMQAFTRTPAYQELLRRGLAALPSAVFATCPGLISTQSSVNALKPITFNAEGAPTAGAWKQSLSVGGCGDDKTLNFYFSVDAQGRIDTIIGAPGDTRADPVLQEDAMASIKLALARIGATCGAFDIKDTRFDGLEAPAAGQGQAQGDDQNFRETWSVIGCGKTYEAPVLFIPRPAGTQIVVMEHISQH